MTTLPRNALSEICWPNWLVSRKLGAARPPRDEPGSRFGLPAPAACCCRALLAADPFVAPLPAPHAATAAAVTKASATAAARRNPPHPERDRGLPPAGACTHTLP